MTKRIAIISTGGTIEKTYNELSGLLQNNVSNLDMLLAQLVLSCELVRVPLMNKDSLEMVDKDHNLIAKTASAMAEAHDGVVIVHGTDRLAESGERTYEMCPDPGVPIIFTGAMRPYEVRMSDAMQNVTEALLAAQFLPSGVYAVLHNQVLTFPGVRKDTARGRFENAPTS